MNPEFKPYTGTAQLPGIYKTAQTISQHIYAEPLMANISPKGMLGYMKHHLATWLEDTEGNISGVVKVLPWHPNLAQVEGGLEKMEEKAIENMDRGNSPTGFELGSLLIPKDYRRHHLATDLVTEITTQVHTKYPGKLIFSVVALNNDPSNKLFVKQGWSKLNEEQIMLFLETMGIDVLQGWNANIYLDPESMQILMNGKNYN